MNHSLPTFPIRPSPGSAAELSEYGCNTPPRNPGSSRLVLGYLSLTVTLDAYLAVNYLAVSYLGDTQ